MLLSMSPSAVPLPPSISTAASTYPDLLQHHMPPTKRPKLSLQTSSLPATTYGLASSHTGGNSRLGASDMSAATPTTLNTFANTFDLSIRPSPITSAVASPSTSLSTRSAIATKPNASTATSIAAPLSRPTKRQLPYDLNLPLGVRPILKNSTLPLDYRRASLSAVSASPRSASHPQRRVFFPEPKRVKFGGEEEVVNRSYVARHYDLSSSEDEESSSTGDEKEKPEALGGSDSLQRQEQPDQETSTAVPPGSSDLSEKAVSLVVDELHQRSPTRGRAVKRSTRKRRRWEWTLGGSPSKASVLELAVDTEKKDEGQSRVIISVDEVEVTTTPTSSSPATATSESSSSSSSSPPPAAAHV